MSLAQRQQSIPLELTRADKQTGPDPGWLDFAGYLVRKFAITGDLLSNPVRLPQKQVRQGFAICGNSQTCRPTILPTRSRASIGFRA